MCSVGGDAGENISFTFIGEKCQGYRANAALCMLFKEKDFASSDAAEGLSGRSAQPFPATGGGRATEPLETFGCHLPKYIYSPATGTMALLFIPPG